MNNPCVMKILNGSKGLIDDERNRLMAYARVGSASETTDESRSQGTCGFDNVRL